MSAIAQVSEPSPLSVSPTGSGVTNVTSVGRVSLAFAPVTTTDDVLVAVRVYVIWPPGSTVVPDTGSEAFDRLQWRGAGWEHAEVSCAPDGMVMVAVLKNPKPGVPCGL